MEALRAAYAEALDEYGRALNPACWFNLAGLGLGRVDWAMVQSVLWERVMALWAVMQDPVMVEAWEVRRP